MCTRRCRTDDDFAVGATRYKVILIIVGFISMKTILMKIVNIFIAIPNLSHYHIIINNRLTCAHYLAPDTPVATVTSTVSSKLNKKDFTIKHHDGTNTIACTAYDTKIPFVNFTGIHCKQIWWWQLPWIRVGYFSLDFFLKIGYWVENLIGKWWTRIYVGVKYFFISII